MYVRSEKMLPHENVSLYQSDSPGGTDVVKQIRAQCKVREGHLAVFDFRVGEVIV